MKNHELLDMIGEVSEDYVQAAGNAASRPRFRWKTWAACAACAALIAAAYPVSQTFRPAMGTDEASNGLTADSVPEGAVVSSESLIQRPGLHPYTVVEEERRIMTTQGKAEAFAGSAAAAPAPNPESGMAGEADTGGLPAYNEKSGDIPMQEGAWYYDRLMQGMDIPTDGSPAVYPEWFGGAWVAGGEGELLAVAIVAEDRTPELEDRIRAWTSESVVFHSVKYSQNYLDGLMEGISQVFEELDCHISSVYGVYVIDNYLDLDFYGAVPSDEVLAALAELDPEGDAIRIQVFTKGRIDFTEGPEQGLALEPASTSAARDGQADPSIGGLDVPAETSAAPEELPRAKEGSQPAHYDLLPPED